MAVKKAIDVETLLRWAYRDELSKRMVSSAEGIWDRIEDNGQRGGIDVGHGAAQRYPHFGLPHPDAEEIERQVSALPDGAIDWQVEAEPIMGDLLQLADPRPMMTRPPARRRPTVGWHGHGGAWGASRVDLPREAIMVRSLRTAALVTMHAKMGTRPDWGDTNPPRPHAIKAERGPGWKVVGECRAKNLYTEGSYCPLQFSPSPLTIAEIRADYLAWWRGLNALVATLELTEHAALPPVSPEMPWLEPARSPSPPPSPALGPPGWPSPRSTLPLKPSRSTAGPRKRVLRAGIARIVPKEGAS